MFFKLVPLALVLLVASGLGLCHNDTNVDPSSYQAVPGPAVGLEAPRATPTPTTTPEPTPVPTPVPTPQPPPPPPPAPPPVPVSDASSIICAYGWDCATAMRVVDCETGGTWDPGSVSSYGEIGWFQINPIHFWRFDASRLADPVYNTACAWELYAESGWAPWRSCC